MNKYLLILFVVSVICKDTNDVTLDHSFETDHWAIQLEPGTNPSEIAERHGHEFIGQVGHLEHVYLFKKRATTVHGETHPHHDESEEIVWHERQVARQLAKRSVDISDPFFGVQWHLHGPPTEKLNVNVEGAWKQGINGQGVVIAMVDDGLEYTHPDLAANYRANCSYDFNYGDSDPFPDSIRDDHGTSAGGVAAARDNSACGVGSAYRAQLTGIRVISKASTDAQEAGAISYMYNCNDIYSNSWGPIDDGRRKEGPGKLAAASLELGIKNGRHGKGSLYVWAGGNGRRSRDNCNYDGWANSRYTISIPAIDFSGEQAWYSESCSMLVVSAPSSGYGSKSIFTTDLMGTRGTSRDDCTSTFGGTSAAAPLVAGVVALIVHANPNLGWRDVQGVLIESSRRHRDTDPSWITNAAGYRYSHNFGFGLIDASRAVEIARDWKNYPTPEEEFAAEIQSNVPFSNQAWSQVSITVNASFVVEHVYATLIATCARRGDLEVRLVSPWGTTSNLAELHGDVGANYDWRFGSIVNWGEESKGIWKLVVRDASGGHGAITGFKLHIFGHLEMEDDKEHPGENKPVQQ